MIIHISPETRKYIVQKLQKKHIGFGGALLAGQSAGCPGRARDAIAQPGAGPPARHHRAAAARGAARGGAGRRAGPRGGARGAG